MNEWFIASSEEIKSSPKMDGSCRHIPCHNLISSSTVNQSKVLTTAFSISPPFSLALGLRLGRCRSAPPRSALLFFFIFYTGRSPPSACSGFASSSFLSPLHVPSVLVLLPVMEGEKLGVVGSTEILKPEKKHRVLDLSRRPPPAPGGEALLPVLLQGGLGAGGT